ncbi:SDR family oxidoreductase [Rhodococcus sp. NPDC019627]|uniref:SDR family oxidoreductase n=1 Tax=unclassified Rhodococcus (in: high G+C Gram-positive bacteria) TaxID=192944 RepID=UPI0033DF3549
MTIAIVTGAARGIGFRIASRLAEDGHHPVLVDLDPSVTEAAEELGGIGLQADIASSEGRADVASSVRAAQKEAGRLAVLVNNAGITRDAQIKNMAEVDFRLVTRVNLGSMYGLITELADEIVDGGAVINVSSRAQLGNFGQFNYAVSKGGVIGLTRALALRHAPRLRMNVVGPGFISTVMTDAMPESVREKIISAVPMDRAGQPDDIAEAAAWLASDRSGYITGQVVYCCGGRSYA